jgi:hypothetical protein
MVRSEWGQAGRNEHTVDKRKETDVGLATPR